MTNPLNPVLVARTDETGQSRYAQTFGADDGSTYNDFIHHNSMRIRNSSLAALPAGADPAADSNVVAVTEEDYNRPTCRGRRLVRDVGDPADRDAAAAEPTTRARPCRCCKPLDNWDVEVDPTRQTLCSAHYFDDRGGLIAQGWYEQGVRFLDISNPRDIRQVGFYIPQKNLMWGALYPPTDPTGEIVYALDNAARHRRPALRPAGPGPCPCERRWPTAGANASCRRSSRRRPTAPGVGEDEVPGRARSGAGPTSRCGSRDGRSAPARGQRLRWRSTVAPRRAATRPTTCRCASTSRASITGVRTSRGSIRCARGA